jgi:hypothetical protein
MNNEDLEFVITMFQETQKNKAIKFSLDQS